MLEGAKQDIHITAIIIHGKQLSHFPARVESQGKE